MAGGDEVNSQGDGEVDGEVDGQGEGDGEVVRLERLTDEHTPVVESQGPGRDSQASGPPVRTETAADARPGDVDPFAGLRSDVVAYGHVDPLETLRGLAAASGISVGALARYVLARWASGGTEALLELGVSGVDHLARVIEQAEAHGSDAARLEAYESVREIIGWLRAGVDP